MSVKLYPHLKTALAIFVFIFMSCQNEMEKARACYQIGDYPRAKKLFSQVIDKKPTSFQARYGYALVLQEMVLKKKKLGRDSLSDWAQVVQAYGICEKLGSVESFSRNYSNAIFHLANKLQEKGNYIEALEWANKTMQLDPNNIYCLNLLGILNYKMGRFSNAAETFELLLGVDSSFNSAYLNLGNVLWEQNHIDSALGVWKQGLETNPQNEALIERIDAALNQLMEQ